MTKKKITSGQPVFVPRKASQFDLATVESAEAFEKFLRGVRSVREQLKASLATMRAAALKALQEPDVYNTHQPAHRVLELLPTLEYIATSEDDEPLQVADVLQLIQNMASAAQAWMVLRVNAVLSRPVNQSRKRRVKTKEIQRPWAPRCDPNFIKKVLAKGLSVKEEMNMLGVSRSTVGDYRRKYGTRRNL